MTETILPITYTSNTSQDCKYKIIPENYGEWSMVPPKKNMFKTVAFGVFVIGFCLATSNPMVTPTDSFRANTFISFNNVGRQNFGQKREKFNDGINGVFSVDTTYIITPTIMRESQGVDGRTMVVDMQKENLNRLEAIKGFQENWNGYGAETFSDSLIKKCIELIENLRKQPILNPTGRKSIQIEYDSPKGSYLEFEMFENRIFMFKIDENENESSDDFEFNHLAIDNINKELQDFT